MNLPYYVVDAFAEAPFTGNPAGVCVLDEWLPDELMQAIATENRLSETAFCVRRGPRRYELRWFTPACEIDLCGHATFGTSFVLFSFVEPEASRLEFDAPMKGYHLVCERMREGADERIRMVFPRIAPAPYPGPDTVDEITAALGAGPAEVLVTERDLICVYDDEATVREMQPDLSAVAALKHGLSVYVTAPATGYDYVARAFWPKIGIPEDPVCGSMQSALVPYWSARLSKADLVCFEPSARTGIVWCHDSGEAAGTVTIAGHGMLYLQGQLTV